MKYSKFNITKIVWFIPILGLLAIYPFAKWAANASIKQRMYRAFILMLYSFVHSLGLILLFTLLFKHYVG